MRNQQGPSLGAPQVSNSQQPTPSGVWNAQNPGPQPSYGANIPTGTAPNQWSGPVPSNQHLPSPGFPSLPQSQNQPANFPLAGQSGGYTPHQDHGIPNQYQIGQGNAQHQGNFQNNAAENHWNATGQKNEIGEQFPLLINKIWHGDH